MRFFLFILFAAQVAICGFTGLPNAMASEVKRGRSAIRYGGDNYVLVHDKHFEMNGFRFMATYYEDGPTYSVPSTSAGAEQIIFGTANDGDSDQVESWYAIFAVANTEDTHVSFRMVPYIRVNSVDGLLGRIYMGDGAEMVDDMDGNGFTISFPTISDPAFASNQYVGSDLLIISEAEPNGAIPPQDTLRHKFSGRVAPIIESTSGYIGIPAADMGNINTGDFVLPSPRNIDHYRYLGTVYFEAAPNGTDPSLRNIADTGSIVKAKMTNAATTNELHGADERIVNLRSYISPLATGVIFDHQTLVNTSSTGQLAHTYYSDWAKQYTCGSCHPVAYSYIEKTQTTPIYWQETDITVAFSHAQQFLFIPTGTSVLLNNRTNPIFDVTGWIEE